MSELARSYAKACETAKAAGLEVVVAKPNELFIDIDDDASYGRFFLAWPIVEEMFKGATHTSTPSPSGKKGHLHIRVKLPTAVAEMEAVALQAALGSDPKREALTVQRLREGQDKARLFFEVPAVFR
jgi:hypothetical protein